MTQSTLPNHPVDWPSCECGCGRPVPAAKRNEPKRGVVLGQPRRFVQGHAGRSFGLSNTKPIIERFWPKVRQTYTCWIWIGAKNNRGYGLLRAGGDSALQIRAHRFAYEALVGPIPQGLELDHLCRIKACVNPAHLEPVTSAEHGRRSASL